MKVSYRWSFGILASLIMGLSACGGDGDKPKPKPGVEEAAITSFTVAPETVAAGESVVASWTTEHAVSIELTANGIPVEFGDAQPSEGSATVVVEETTVFELVATGEAGEPARRSVTVEVEAIVGEDPKVLDFTADPLEVEEGETTRLSWATANADSIEIVDGSNQPVDLGGADAASGSVEVEVLSSTTFRLTASSGEKFDSASVTVKVKGAPVANLQVNPGRIAAGETATLVWSTEDAIAVVITDEVGTVLIDSTERLSGEETITPSQTTSYTLVATGASKQATSVATIEVTPSITLFEAVDPSPAGVGDLKELRWEIAGATELTISNIDGFEHVVAGGPEVAEGTVQAPMGTEGKFRLVATSGALVAEREIAIDVVDLPTIGSFSALAPILTADEDGKATATLMWSGVARATQLILESDVGTPTAIDPSLLVAGSVDVEIDGDTTFTLVATNLAGEAQREATVRLVAAPAIDSFIARPSRVGAGEAFELSWATSGATSISISQGGVALGFDPDLTSGTTTQQISADASFELTAVNEAGSSVSQTVAVSVGAPLIVSFEMSGSHVWAGTTVTFAWENIGGSELRLLVDGEVACQAVNEAEIAEGSCDLAMTDIGAHTIALEIENGVGDVSAESLLLRVSSGATIQSFSVAPNAMDAGDELTVSWNVLADPDGAEPTLTLTADLGGPYAIPAGNQGSAAFTLTEVGTYEFTFEATTSSPGSLPQRTSGSVSVFGIPSVTLTATPDVFDDAIMADVELSWTSEHAASLVLYEIDASGASIELLSVAAGSFDAGSHAVVPSRNTTYRVVATNGNGSAVSAEARVTLAPPTIVSFTATPEEVMLGEDVEFTWATRMADGVRLSVIPGILTLTEGAEPLIDIAATGTHIPLGVCTTTFPNTNDEGCKVFTFPAGFSFPFAGEQHDSVMVYANGVLSFDTTRTGSSFSNVTLPSTSSSWAHLAPFWDDLEFLEPGVVDGDVRYELSSDARGPMLIMQWTDASALVAPTAKRTFQIIMRNSGEFEYRYAGSSGDQNRADGSSATIGYQFPDGSDFEIVSYNTAVSGGLDGKSFAFDMPTSLSASGTYIWTPTAAGTVPVTLTATGNGVVSETVEVVVHGVPSLSIVAPPEDLPLAEELIVSWTAEHVSSVEVLDASDVVRCSASAGELSSGSCTIVEAGPGTYDYRVRATGGLGRVLEEEFTVSLFAPFDIESFTVSEARVEYNDTVDLSWETSGAGVSMRITANGVDITPPSVDLLSGTMTTAALTERTTFVLTLFDVDDREVDASQVVIVRTFDLDLLASQDVVRPGEAVDLSWTATSLSGGIVEIFLPVVALAEDLAGDVYVDISGLPEAEELVGRNVDGAAVTHVFTDGFTFTYGGVEYTEVRVTNDGWISFDTTAATNFSNQTLPNDSTAAHSKVQLAVFWDDLHTRENGRVHAAMVGGDYIISWSHTSAYAGSSLTNEYDLNFQIVLHSDGTFEYRYGDMVAPPSTSTSCYPNTCENEAMGSSATIGFQLPGGTQGHELHFGGTSGNANNPPFPGGLAHRTFRSDAVATGDTFTVNPSGTTSYQICGRLDGFVECKTITVEAPFEIGSFVADLETINWGDAVNLSWTTIGADELILEAGAVELGDETTLGVDSGTAVDSPEGTLTYVLTVKNTFLSKTLTASVAVEVKDFDLSASVSAGTARPGDEITLDWTVTALNPNLDATVITPMQEVSATSSYVDISGEPGVVEVIAGNIDSSIVRHSFDAGFTFPFMGVTYDSVGVSSDGYLSFSTNTSTASSNQPIPNTSSSYNKVSLAAFWDDLHTRASGRVFAGEVGGEYIVQWSQISLYYGSSHSSSGTNEFDLNFQIALQSDGSFEYRYGTMAQPPQPAGSLSDCNPRSCEKEANGSSATIGFQNLTGTIGQQLHFGGTGRAFENPSFAGGLSDRAFRFSATTGSGSMVVNPTDSTDYQVCVIFGSVTECVSVAVTAEWEILTFEASSEAIVEGEDVTLSWTTAGADALSLLHESAGVITPIDIDGLDLAEDSVVLSPTSSGSYILELESMGRIKQVILPVEVRTLNLDFTTSSEVVFSGETVTVSWDATPVISGAPSMVVAPMVELDTSSGSGWGFADLDISQDPAATEILAGGEDTKAIEYAFDGGFTFPFMGESFSRLRVATDGYLSFEETTSTTGTGANYGIPNTNSSYSKISLAAFWDDLATRTSGRVHGMMIGPDTYVFQWSHVSRFSGSSDSNEYDLNFQIVLHSDGSFEYRYGTMAPPPTLPTSTGTCNPLSCENEVNGSSATIGYQNLTGTVGLEHHFGGNGVSATNPAFPGGLEGRSFRFDTAPASAITLEVTETRTFRACAELRGFVECKSVTVFVPSEGDVIISELMLDPDVDPAAQWFEVRNQLPIDLDLEGWTISSSAATHVIASSFVVPAKGYAILEATAGSGLGYIYGSGLALDPSEDSLELHAGSALIASVEWDSSWQVPVGASLELESENFDAGSGIFSDRGAFCVARAVYDGVNLGSPGAIPSCTTKAYWYDPASTMSAIDISGIDTPVAGITGYLTYTSTPVALSFPFPFYGVNRTAFYLSSVGFLTTNSISASHFSNVALGATSAPLGGGIIAPFWDDTSFIAGESTLTFAEVSSGGQQVAVFQWTNWRPFGGASTTRSNYQVQLWEDGGIVFVYGDLIGDETYTKGSSATVGIQQPGSTTYQQHSYNQAVLSSGQSIHYWPAN